MRGRYWGWYGDNLNDLLVSGGLRRGNALRADLSDCIEIGYSIERIQERVNG
jgi:hypothetical protein